MLSLVDSIRSSLKVFLRSLTPVLDIMEMKGVKKKTCAI